MPGYIELIGTLWHSLNIHCVKKWTFWLGNGQVRSGHQSRSNDPKKCNCTVATIFKRSIWNFQELTRTSFPTKHISPNFVFGDQRSGQWCDLTFIRQWENVEMPFIPKIRLWACYLSRDILILHHSRWPICSIDPMTSPGHSRSYEVKLVFAYKFW